mgnify:CR=1 FL=1
MELLGRKICSIPLASFGVAFWGTMVVVGSIYSDCKLGVLLWLKAGGGIMLSMSILAILWICFASDKTDKYKNCLTALVKLPLLGVIIWGSIVTFGSYSSWTYELKSSDDYCEHTPYMFAFIVLIVSWILSIPIIMYIAVSYTHLTLTTNREV